MIKVYTITRPGRGFLRQKVSGHFDKELQGALKDYKEESGQNMFFFDTQEFSPDHSYRQHMKHLEKLGFIKRDSDKEQEVREFIKSQPKDELITMTEIITKLLPAIEESY